MPYCTRCGKELREGDRFCPNCGEAVREAKEQSGSVRQENTQGVHEEQVQEQDAQPEKAPEPGAQEEQIQGARKKRTLLIGGIVAAVVVLAVLVIAVIAVVFGGRRTVYATYQNEETCFSVDYPEGYTVTEPNDNNVVITEGKDADFQVVIEYAYSTLSDSAIYSAEDFAGQIVEQPGLLTDWLGSEDAQIEDAVRTEIAGRDCYEYDFSLEMDGAEHTGKLYLFDSDGEFGCYSYMSVINEEAQKAKLYHEQSEAMEQSFKLTGAYQVDGYTLYDYGELDLKFMVRDSAMGETEQSDSRNALVVYPVEGVYSKANIWIHETAYEEEEKDVSTVLEQKGDYYFSYKDQAQYLSQPGEMGYGRYPYTGVDLQYSEKGEQYTASLLAFAHDGTYWTIEMESTEEYYDTAATALSDILFSLKFGDDGADDLKKQKEQEDEDEKEDENSKEDADANEQGTVAEILNEIEGSAGFASDSTWEPLVAADDFNGDGTQELVAVYEAKDGSTFNMMYEVWSLGKKPVKLESAVLFAEVGGNSGTVGIVKKDDGKVYLALEQENPEGEDFNNYYTYTPWEEDESSLGDAWYYLESHGSYGQEEQGRYILGDTTVSKEEFDRKREEFSDWTYKLDPLAGPEDDGVMTFEEAKKK